MDNCGEKMAFTLVGHSTANKALFLRYSADITTKEKIHVETYCFGRR